MLQIIKSSEKIKRINKKPWSPMEIARLNGQMILLNFVKGEGKWHEHKKFEEMFYVVSGKFMIMMKGRPAVKLNKGEFVVVPRGKEHCAKSARGAYVLIFEPSS